MLTDQLRDFIDRVSDRGHVSEDDVRMLEGEILRDGITSRLEAESLLALDRIVTAAEGWGTALARLIADFVVWKRAPQGAVSNDDALWLATLLEVGGPSPNAMAIAYAILDEAGHVDVALLDFIMRGRQQARLSQIAA
ncbi:hypothetical protein [Microvirga arsenatis]|uniref:Uncharacterized protein n=1 Tax=Microvirga arsenatis TaxID=2692265 RepID=A0ABW9Z4G4_9HYPH|nr:hypothetical protein [Microvirga arsenatis]NBJ12357.1 hypothetical protein [Microvirga arsenatis]NBJ26148.1 hypothetical protein [Microvirga arsenatis]